jgi:hypothetical protein
LIDENSSAMSLFMRCRTLFIGCVGFVGMLAMPRAQAQSNNSALDATLQVLRQQEAAESSGKPKAKPVAPAAVAPATAAPSTANIGDNSAAFSVLRQLEAGPAPSKSSPHSAAKLSPATVAPATVSTPVVSTSTSSDPNARALEVLRQQEAGVPAPKSSINAAVVNAPAVSTSVGTDANSQALEVLRQKENPPAVITPGTPTLVGADAAQLEFIAAKKAALLAEQKRQNAAEQKALQDGFAGRVPVTTNAAPTLTPEVTAPTPTDATMPQPQATTSSAPLVATGTREEKLAELLRQWRAGEITPLQYYTQRARIIAEP